MQSALGFWKIRISRSILPMFVRNTVLSSLGKVVVIAPHPDDETLGCGGLIRLLRERDQPVTIVFVSDGAGSHPHSYKYSEMKLGQLRAAEARAAAQVLGVPKRDLIFLGLRDRAVPHRGETGFAEAMAMIAKIFRQTAVDTVLSPSRHDAHCDHEASFELAVAAIARQGRAIRLLEYAIWSEEPESLDDMIVFDIAAVVDCKRAAIACHKSQLTRLIDDDPSGFLLPPALIARCTTSFEHYRETSL
jgi:LmbE family N-acetylglucosaminyl deacetylase